MHRHTLHSLLLAAAMVLLVSCQSSAQTPADPGNQPEVRPRNRVTKRIDDRDRAVLAGNRHPWARPEDAIGEVPPDQPMEQMVLVLRADPAQEQALDELVRAQQDPRSPNYHKWLTPKSFGERFGISHNDLEQVVNWLQVHGMKVEETPPSRRTITFSGTAAQVESAFRTPIRKYSVEGGMHYANARDPEIPQALAAVVHGVVSLHDFRSKPAHVVAPAFTTGNGTAYLVPPDWSTIYDVTPLYSQGLDGTGQSIAVVGRSDISLQDVETFRNYYGLPANDPQTILAGADPGWPDCGDEIESALDVEWAGAIAKKATVKFVTAQSGATDGIVLSAQYAVNHVVAPILTVSYSACEANLGQAGNAFWNLLWTQAASQGMSVFVSSGDAGAATCDSSEAATATHGRAVNGLCSSTFSTCVGGTEFNEGPNPSLYWSAKNSTGFLSALSYIPELAWNESASSGALYSTGGGVSTVYNKPGWQTAPGVPADGKRDVPDVSMAAAAHDAYVIETHNMMLFMSGTSAAAPSLASLMALVVQNTGAPLGNINPALYTLANQQLSVGGPVVFHDIVSGNNTVPGATGYSAGRGYDLATGLGSVDGANLVKKWGSVSAPWSVLSPPGFVFANQPLNTTSTAQTVTLSNAGGAALAITSVTLTGTNPYSFVQTNTCGSTLNAGASCTVSVSFRPTGTSGRSAFLTIADNAPGSPHNVSLAGTGTAPAVSLSPASIAAGSQAVGTSSTAQTVTLSNTGNAALTITSVAITSSSPFSLLPNTCGSTLNAGASCTISAKFQPTALVSSSAVITITDDAPGSPHSVSLTGSGVTPPAVSLSPTSLTFASQTVSTSSAAQTITLRNTGGAALAITSVAITGSCPGSFSQSNTCGSTLGAGASCTISAKFQPTGASSKNAFVTITDNAPGSPHSVSLTGAGVVAPAVSVSPAGLTFASQTVSTSSAAQTVTLSNTGNAALTLTSVAITSSSPFSLLPSTCGSTLNAGASCTISAKFQPTALVSSSAVITITDNAPGSPHSVSLTGTGVGPPAVSLSPTSMTFASQAVSTSSAAQTVTLRNTGNGPLTITSVAITGSCPGSFSQSNTCGSTLGAGATCTISAKFQPTGASSKNAFATITDNAPGSPHSVSLSGTGVVAAPVVSLSPTSLTFVSQKVGTSSAAQTITLRNTGNGALAITSVAITGSCPGSFAQSNTCGSTLNAGATCTISAKFQPTGASSKNAFVTVTDNAPGSPHSVSLAGTGAAATAGH